MCACVVCVWLCLCVCVCVCVCGCVYVHKWADMKVAAPGFQKWSGGLGAEQGKFPKWCFVQWISIRCNWTEIEAKGGHEGGGCRILVSDGRGNDFECPPPPLTPTPASPLTLLANWRTHFYVRLLTSSGASGFWSISQKCVMCSQAWNDIHQIWYQKNQKELIYKMISLIPIFRA